MPCLVINYLRSKKQKIFPYTTPYNDKEIIKFLDQNYLGKSTVTDLEY